MYMTIWIANQTIPWMTKLGVTTGTADGTNLVAALDQGGSPITYVFTQIFAKENLTGAAVIAVLYLVCLLYTVFSMRKMKKAQEKSLRNTNDTQKSEVEYKGEVTA